MFKRSNDAEMMLAKEIAVSLRDEPQRWERKPSPPIESDCLGRDDGMIVDTICTRYYYSIRVGRGESVTLSKRTRKIVQSAIDDWHEWNRKRIILANLRTQPTST